MKRVAPPTPNRWRNFYHLSETDSTNEEAIRFIARGVRSGIVVADAQTAGRGRNGSSWFSPSGKNLYVSFFERTTPDRALDAAKVAGLAVFDTVAAFVDPARLRLKWPNDLLADGKKLCGVLIQHLSRGRDLFTVTGIGINLVTPDKTAFSWRWEPTSIEEAGHAASSRSTVLSHLAAALTRWNGAPADTVDATYAQLLAWMQGALTSWRSGADEEQGTIVGFGERGLRIVLRTESGEEKELAAGEITSIMVS